MTEPSHPAVDPRKAAILEAFAELRAEYAEGLTGLVSDLEAAADIACSERTAEEIGHLTTLAHRMHGAAGSYGFKGVSAAAATMEDLLGGRDASGAPFDDTFANTLLAALRNVRGEAERELGEMRANGEGQKG